MLWITGNKGLLGSSLSTKCKERKIAMFETGKEIDIADLNQIRTYAQKHPGIAHIVNCAAFSQVDAAEKMRQEAYRANAIGPENLAIVANEIGANLIHISTDYVFSTQIERPFTEEDLPSPCNYYGQTKLEGEQRSLERGACVVRTSWVFGLNGKNLISNLLQILQTKSEISLTDDQWSRFTYVKDLADAILKILDQKGLYQFANAGVASKYEFALEMKKEAHLLNYPILNQKIIPVSAASFPDSCKRPTYSALDTSKIENFLPIRHWKEALKDFLCEKMPACL